MSLDLAAARDQCPGRHVLAGQVTQLRPEDAKGPVTGPGGTFHGHVTVLGRFRLTR